MCAESFKNSVLYIMENIDSSRQAITAKMPHKRSGSQEEHTKVIFCDPQVDEAELEATNIESLCMNCSKNGTTRLLLSKIPHFKDVVIMSFECEHCGYRNNEVQPGGKISERGTRISLRVTSQQDLNRQVVKSDYTSIKIPSLEFEIPQRSQNGEVTTVEGILDRSITSLEQDQAQRRKECPSTADQIDHFLKKLCSLKSLNDPYVIIFEDISGECHVQNINIPLKDEGIDIVKFKRTKEQDGILGIYSENEDVLLKPVREGEYTLEQIGGEVLTFHTNCPDCNSPCETNMKLTNIPHFKEVVIMATVCESCGHRTNEVKSSGGVEQQGVRMEVSVAGKEDFNRDLLKSETCYVTIPELALEVGPVTFGGRFTTVEGVIVAIKEQLSSSTAFIGDSSDQETLDRMGIFISQLHDVLDGKRKVTLVLDDPAGNSYIQSLADGEVDCGLKITKYDRTFEQNEELGLNDIKVEDY